MNFSELYRRYVGDVHRFALYLSGNNAIAEDLTSETFVHALYGSSELRIGTVKAYLFAIARNLYRDAVVRQRRLVSIRYGDMQADPDPSPDRRVSGRQALSAVLLAIQELPEPQREALALAVDREMRYEQIAAILGCSVPAVKVRIHRARIQLRRELEKTKCRM